MGCIIVLAWLILALIGYTKAVKAGYSQLVALIGAILLGPFAPLLAFVKPAGKRCGACMSFIDERATVCPKCGRDQTPAAPTA